MAERPIEERLEVLEQKVEMLEALPERLRAVELQIVQLRAEIRDGFSATQVRAETLEAALRAEIRNGDEETRRYMRILHEDSKSDTALLAVHVLRILERLDARP